MKSKIFSNGMIYIPMQARKRLNIDHGDELAFVFTLGE